jgi:CheY-like chemotaxis protein
VPIRSTLLGFGLAVSVVPSASFAQEPAQPPAAPAGEPVQAIQKKPSLLFRLFREQYLEGKFDVAAETLKEFLAANPTDAELIEIDNKFGATFLLGLRNLPRWSDNPVADAAAKKALEELIAKTREATKKLTQDPKRLAILIRNLGASPEERTYAEGELNRAGAGAIPPMIEVLRSTSDIPQRAGILGAVPKLSASVVPALVASLDGLTDDLKAGVVNAIAARTDLLGLTGRADTDPTPHLWYFAGLPDGQAPTLRDAARRTLEALYGSVDRRPPAEELVRLAKPLTEKKAAFLNTDTTAGNVKVWTWDAAANNVKGTDLSPRQAEEYFALRNLKWAVERNPADETIQAEFLGFAAARAVERANYADLATTNPAVATLLAAAPSDVLTGMLNRALLTGNAPLAYAAITALDARRAKAPADVTSRAGGTPRPSPFVRALDFPDDRVQFAAAVALLRGGNPAHGANAKVIDILKRAASGTDSGAAKAILADPAALRSSRVGEMFRQAGYAVESVGTTRDVLRRVSSAADVDLIVIDRHAHSPTIRDFLVQLRSLPATKSTPVFVVASGDEAKAPKVESLLFRLALLIAATETESPNVPPAFAIDPRRPQKDNDRIKAEQQEFRERALTRLYQVRLARLERLVRASGFRDTPALQNLFLVRLPQLTYAALAAEYPLTKDATPEIFARYEMVSKLVAAQPDLSQAAEGQPVVALIRILEQLENVLTPELQKKFDTMSRAIDPVALALPADVTRDAWLEDRLTKEFGQFANVRVVAEPYSAAAVEQDVRAADAPAPKSGATKASNARAAIEWLRKCAVGEVPGYDVRPAEAVLRAALAKDDVAESAVEAVSRIGTAEVQRDLINVAVNGARPANLRAAAADAAVRHVQTFGKLAPQAQVASTVTGSATESDATVKAKLTVLAGLLNAKPGDLVSAIKAFSPSAIDPPAPKPAAPAKDPNAAPVKDPNAAPPVDPAKPPAGDPKN